jgi:hypothetical protein
MMLMASQRVPKLPDTDHGLPSLPLVLVAT